MAAAPGSFTPEAMAAPHDTGATTPSTSPVNAGTVNAGTVNAGTVSAGSVHAGSVRPDTVSTDPVGTTQAGGAAMSGLGTSLAADAELLDLLASSGDLIAICDADGRLLHVNPAWCAALGGEPAQVLGLEAQSLIGPDDLPGWRQQVERVLGGGGSEAVRLQLLGGAQGLLAVEGSLGRWQREGQAPLLRLILRPLPAGHPSSAAAEAASPADLQRLERQVRERTAELERSRRLLTEAQRIAQVGSWSLDLRRGELLWSDEIYRIFELDPAAFAPSYETFLDCVHPEDRRSVDRAYSQSLIDQQPYEVIHRLLMPDGRIKVISERCETSFSPQGEPLLSIGTALDITAQTQAREQLEQGERKLRSLVELAPLGITLSNLEGELLEWNPAFAAMLGAGPGQPLPQPLRLQAISPEDQREVLQQLHQQLQRRGRGGPVCTRLRRLDGRLIDVKFNALLIQGIESGPQVWAIVEDISESLRIQEQLEQAASVFSHSQEGIIITDTAGKILDVNQALCRISGYKREQLLGSNPRRLKSGLHEEGFYRAMWETLLREGSWSGEVINRGRDGTLLPVQETISAVRGPDGSVHRYIALLTDIRQLKEQQQQLEALALRDPLTGLANRVLLSDRLEQAIHQTLRDPASVLVVGVLDLDGFKQVNDGHGHAAGDHLLQVLADRMQQQLRKGETLARLGGDEFVLLLPCLSGPELAEPLLQRLLAAVREPVLWHGVPLQVSGSIGLSVCRADGGRSNGHRPDPVELLRQADQAMYAAKRGRGNGWLSFADLA